MDVLDNPQRPPTSDYTLSALGTTPYSRISPFWQDLKTGTNGKISFKLADNFDYFAITWENMEIADSENTGNWDGMTGSFQTILFEANTTLNGIDFLAGDIIFSYNDLQFFNSLNDVIIGIQGGIGTFAFAPDGGFDGYHTEGWYNPNLLHSFPYADDEYILFRATGSDYIVSIETMAIPEPTSMAALLSGALLIGWRTYRRRKSAI